MVEDTLDYPRRFHCRELDSERTGILTIGKGETELYFIGYDDFVYIREDSPSFVLTEEGDVVSLYMNILGRHSSKYVTTKFVSPEGNKYREISQGGIWSNLAVVGVDAWRPEEFVRRVTFDVAHTEHILEHREKLRSLGRRSTPSDDDLTLYRAVAGGVTLTAGYAVSYGLKTRSLTTCRPMFSVEFEVGCPLNDVSKHLIHYLSFLSFVLGGRMTPETVRIDRMSFEEMLHAVEARTYIRDHAVVWNWPADEHKTQDLAFHGAPFLAQDNAELTAFEAGLAAWVERVEEWEAAYVRMTESFRLQRMISGERLFAAWRWFEEIPTAKAVKAVLENDIIEHITQAALSGAREKGLDGSMERRIQGVLKQISEESAQVRFERLVASVRDSLNGGDRLDGMIEHLLNARRFRGKVAHGHFASRDEAEGRRFNKATLAMEALCFLLTARDLPITEKGRQRIWSHPVIEAYELAFP